MKKRSIVILIIFIIAIVFRIFFITKTDFFKYQYDFGYMPLTVEEDYSKIYEEYSNARNEGRHINYIMYLHDYNKLPDKIIGQFYQPPLHHFILANWLKLVEHITTNNLIRFESMQYVALAYSIIILIIIKKIMDELEIKDQVLPFIFFSFYPLMIYISRTLNNDQLVSLFELLCLLYLIKWRKDPNFKNTIIGALAVGLGLMTKSSMLVMLVPTMIVFFKVLNEYVTNDKSIKNLLLEIIIFVIIVVPLGFWYHIYRGTESFGIIQPLEELSVANRSLLERFGISNPFAFPTANIWATLILTSIDYGGVTDTVLIKIFIALDCMLIYNWIYCFIKSKKDSLLIITSLTWWFGYFYLNITMPYTCSMNARYMIIPIVIGVLDITKGLEKEKSKFMKIEIYANIILISILSIYYFINL